MRFCLVACFSFKSIDQIKSIEETAPCVIAREAAYKANDQDIADLRAIVGRQREALGDADAFISADMEFHSRIAKISGNPIFVGVSEAMLAWLREYHTHMLIWTGKENYTLVEHEEIIDMLAAKNSDGVEAAMLHHLERSRALYTK